MFRDSILLRYNNVSHDDTLKYKASFLQEAALLISWSLQSWHPLERMLLETFKICIPEAVTLLIETSMATHSSKDLMTAKVYQKEQNFWKLHHSRMTLRFLILSGARGFPWVVRELFEMTKWCPMLINVCKSAAIITHVWHKNMLSNFTGSRVLYFV